MEIKLLQIIKELGLHVFTMPDTLEGLVSGGYVSDLLSDVMGNSKLGDIWVTLQTHKNVVAIASLRDLAAVIIVNGLTPDAETIESANAEGVALLGTTEKTFEISGKLYNLIYR